MIYIYSADGRSRYHFSLFYQIDIEDKNPYILILHKYIKLATYFYEIDHKLKTRKSINRLTGDTFLV